MPNCSRIKPSPYKVCISDLRSKITIKKRIKSALNTSGPTPRLTLSDLKIVYAMQRSIDGEEIFDGTNIIGRITDEFIIRYDPNLDINKTNIISYNGYLYDINDIVNDVNGRRRLTKIRCSVRGIDDLLVNKLANQ